MRVLEHFEFRLRLRKLLDFGHKQRLDELLRSPSNSPPAPPRRRPAPPPGGGDVAVAPWKRRRRRHGQ